MTRNYKLRDLKHAYAVVDELTATNAELLAALKALTATARTFRNVPASEQEWTALDDEALDAAFAAIAKAEGES